MRVSMFKWLTPLLLLAALAAPLFATSSSYAAGLFAFTPSDHDRRCLIDLQNADRISLVVLQRKMAALPEGCHARCPFRNISPTFFVQRIRGVVLRKACLLHVTPAETLVSMGEGEAVQGRSENNVVYIYQDGTGNVVAVYQNGSGNFSYTYQDGSGNVVTVQQKGSNNTAGIAQFGNGNSLNLTQNGNNNSFFGVQTDGDSLSVTQSGNQNQVSIQ